MVRCHLIDIPAIRMAFRDRLVHKMYVALVYGRVSQERGEIDARIGRSPQNRTRMTVLRGGAGRTAFTSYEVVKRYTEFTLLEVVLKTGRTHQIRVHMSHIGHPVVGDIAYGKGRENSLGDFIVKRKLKSLGRHLLHSSRLGFTHPRTNAGLLFESPLPVEMVSFLSILQ